MIGLDHILVFLLLLAIPIATGLARRYGRRRRIRQFLSDAETAVMSELVFFKMLGVSDFTCTHGLRRGRMFCRVTIHGPLRDVTVDVTGLGPRAITMALLLAGLAASTPEPNQQGAAQPPQPSIPTPEWTVVLGLPVDATRSDIMNRWRDLARMHHPDAGGDVTRMQAINEAKDQALASLA